MNTKSINSLLNYIIKLQLFTNKYFKYDIKYIKDKYNIDSYSEYKKYFKKKYKNKLIFNSYSSEKLFINFFNIDYDFLKLKYKENQYDMFINFFIAGKIFFFNKCDEQRHINSNTDKLHLNNCNCKIKVKTIVNINIKAFLFILNQYNIDNQPKNIIKISKNENNKELVNCINKLEKINLNLGINNINNEYILESDLSNNYTNNIIVSENNNNNYNYINNINTQLDSEIIDLVDIKINKKLNQNIKLKSETSSKSESESSSKSEENSKSEEKIETETETSSKSVKDTEINDIKLLFKELIEYLDINNNILIDKIDSITKNAINIKKVIKTRYSDKLALQFDKIFQKLLLMKTLNSTDDMLEYYKLHNEIIKIEKLF